MKPNNPDETEGRKLYRTIADRDARMQIGLTRRVKLRAPDGGAMKTRPTGEDDISKEADRLTQHLLKHVDTQTGEDDGR